MNHDVLLSLFVWKLQSRWGRPFCKDQWLRADQFRFRSRHLTNGLAAQAKSRYVFFQYKSQFEIKSAELTL